PDLIILAGFMRILTPHFISQFRNKILNIHPSLLPKYPGLNTYQQVIANGDKWHGATVHVVTEVLDSGPIIGYTTVPVIPSDDSVTLQVKVHAVEHQLYPYVIALFAKGRLQIVGDCVMLDGRSLPPEGFEYHPTGIPNG